MPAVDPKSPLTILAASGVALLIFMFLPWYGADLSDSQASAASATALDTTVNVWKLTYTDLLLFLAGVVAIATFALASMGHELTPTVVKVAAGLGVLATLFVIGRIIDQPGPNEFIKVKYGAFLGLIAVVGIVYGAWRTMRDGASAG